MMLQALEHLSSDDLLSNLLRELTSSVKGTETLRLLKLRQGGDWVLSHTNPATRAIREIAQWQEKRLLSEVIDEDAYDVKLVATKKLVSLWLCWQPADEISTP